jgi:hypothetical protein
MGASAATAAVDFDRLRFAGQRSLLDAQVAQFDQPQVGRHLVAGSKHDDIARHQLAGIDLLPPAVAHHDGTQPACCGWRRAIFPPCLPE